MKPEFEPNHLLDDVLAESAPADFRAAVLGETLLLARRRRWARHTRRVAIAAAIACIITRLVWQRSPDRLPMISSQASCEIVVSQPLAAGARVTTQVFAAERRVASVAGVDVIRTDQGSGSIQIVDDAALLVLAAPRIAALVRIGPNAQKLIFADSPEPDGRR